MSKFDNDEQKIYDALSQINVDPSKLVGKVKGRLHEEPVCIETKRKGRWTKSTVAAIVMSLVLVTTATAAALGGFDWFMERFNPSFSRIVEPVELYSEEQGIRMEVIGAQKYDNMAIVYLSLQDTTGENRLTEDTDFRDGFNIKTNQSAQKSGKLDEVVSGFSRKQKVIYFNEDTNTIYYEFNITSDPNSPLSNSLEISSFLIYFDERSYTDEPIDLSLTEIGQSEITSIKEEHIWGGSNISDNKISYTEVLTPSYYTDMPHGEDDQWVSNIGIIDGKLHVQIGNIFNQEFGSNDAGISLMDPEGNLIPSDYKLMLLGDEDNRLLNLKEHDYADAKYKYHEFVFPVIEDFSGYTLCYTGEITTGVEGNWKVNANLSDSNQSIISWENDIPVEGHLFEYITLNPLGLQVIGSYEGEKLLVNDMSLAVETVDGIIPLEGGGGSQDINKHTFSASWNTKSPLDVSKVTAIIINEVKIPVK